MTVLYPFLPPDRINRAVLTAVEAAVRTVPQFPITFQRLEWFGESVVWLAPEPDSPLPALTAAVSRQFPALEDLIEQDPSILGETLLLIGRQVPTDFGKFVDLLAVDADGVIHVLELKKDKTPREVVAQLLDYGSWVRKLMHEQVLNIYSTYTQGKNLAFEAASEERFNRTPPEDLNTRHRLTIIASELDAATERIVNYLVEPHNVPINLVYFTYYEDDDRRYLARTWLIDQERVGDAVAAQRSRTSEPWNGQDWYVSFGDEEGSRSWEDARRYGFVSAGGGEWYSNTIRKLPVGARVFAYIPKAGYVGVGEVTGEAAAFDQAVVSGSGGEQRLADLPRVGSYDHAEGEEWVVPVAWQQTRRAARRSRCPVCLRIKTLPLACEASLPWKRSRASSISTVRRSRSGAIDGALGGLRRLSETSRSCRVWGR